MKKILGIACADIHRTNMRPACRVEEDIMKVQDDKLLAIIQYARLHSCPILCAGDLYDTWKCGYDVTNNTNYLLRDSSFYACYGQHELPNHSMEESFRSPLTNTLILPKHELTSCNAKGYLPFFASWGQKPKVTGKSKSPKILVMHKTVYYKEKPFPGAKGNILKLLKRPEYAQYDLIISGDNHKAFKVRVGNTLWINCGCVYRTSATELDYVPSCWAFWYSVNRQRIEAKQLPLPFLKDDVSREHIETKNKQDKDADKQQKEWDSMFASSLSLAKKKGERPKSFMEQLKRTIAPIKNEALKKRIWFFTE